MDSKEEPFMKVLPIVLTYLLFLPWISTDQTEQRMSSLFSRNTLFASVKNVQEKASPEDAKGKPIKAIEDYEKEKRAKMKKNIGKRFMAVRTAHPPEFYDAPEKLGKKIGVREKEEFLILEVVQNRSGTMNFYKVRLESGKIGYLSADGSNLEIRIKDGSIMPVIKRVGTKKVSPEAKGKEASKALEMVKNHLIPSDPVSKDKRSVERRMIEVKATSFPNLKWRYEAKEIGNNKYRVTQYAEGESDRPIQRKWIVDLSMGKVRPENIAAGELYRSSNY